MSEGATTPLGETWRRLLRNRSFVIGAVVVSIIVAVAILAPLVAPHDPLRNNFRTRLQPPGEMFWLGTDHFGRDILSRILHGGRISLIIGASVVVVTGIFGTAIGAIAGFFRALDEPIMRLMDAIMAFPAILLAMAIAAVMGASVTNVVIALSIATTPHTARIVRGSVLVVREMEYVEAARAVGAKPARIMLREILPNVLSPVLVVATFRMAYVIIMEASLSFLGLGVQPPTPSWGSMVADGRDFLMGTSAGLADAGAYYNLAFVRWTSPAGVKLIEGFPKVAAWEKRVAAIGHGKRQEISREAALDIAKAATSTEAAKAGPGEPNGLKPGDKIMVMADDYGRDPIAGELVSSSAQHVAIRRNDPRIGDVVVHFPRAGFLVVKS